MTSGVDCRLQTVEDCRRLPSIVDCLGNLFLCQFSHGKNLKKGSSLTAAHVSNYEQQQQQWKKSGKKGRRIENYLGAIIKAAAANRVRSSQFPFYNFPFRFSVCRLSLLLVGKFNQRQAFNAIEVTRQCNLSQFCVAACNLLPLAVAVSVTSLCALSKRTLCGICFAFAVSYCCSCSCRWCLSPCLPASLGHCQVQLWLAQAFTAASCTLTRTLSDLLSLSPFLLKTI